MWQYNQTPSSDELYHYGVLGMKWGKRKSAPRNKVGNVSKNLAAVTKYPFKARKEFMKENSIGQTIKHPLRTYKKNMKRLIGGGDERLMEIARRAKPYPKEGVVETREMLGYTKKGKRTKLRTKQDVADWLENNDAKLRDIYDSGGLRSNKYKKSVDALIKKADKEYKRIDRQNKK